MQTETLSKARELWDYMASFATVGPSDAIIVCCSYDLRVCDYACDLIKAGLSRRLVLSGRTGNWTKHLWNRPEAEIFRDRALANGIDPGSVLLEDRSTNFGENVSFSRDLLPDAKVVTLVTKPASVLRVKLTAQVQWPGVHSHVACPDLRFPEGVSQTIGVFGVIHEMVGDVERIQNYPALGFQAPHKLPQNVLDAWSALIGQGFTHHLLPQP